MYKQAYPVYIHTYIHTYLVVAVYQGERIRYTTVCMYTVGVNVVCVYFIIYDDYLYSISIFIIYIQNVAILVHKVTISTL